MNIPVIAISKQLSNLNPNRSPAPVNSCTFPPFPTTGEPATTGASTATPPIVSTGEPDPAAGGDAAGFKLGGGGCGEVEEDILTDDWGITLEQALPIRVPE